jgi:hypothetical protein
VLFVAIVLRCGGSAVVVVVVCCGFSSMVFVRSAVVVVKKLKSKIKNQKAKSQKIKKIKELWRCIPTVSEC